MGNLDAPADVRKAHTAAAVASKSEVAADIRNPDSAGAVFHRHVPTHFPDVDRPGRVVDADVPSDFVHVDGAGSVIDGDVARDVLELDIAGSVVDGHGAARVLDGQRAGAVFDVQGTDSLDLDFSAAIFDVDLDSGRYLDDYVESRRPLAIPAAIPAGRSGGLDLKTTAISTCGQARLVEELPG